MTLPELPPHDPDADLVVGDQIVITVGEQRGWTGKVTWVDMRSFQITARMTRPDGSPGPEVVHREECVAKLGLQVPTFDSPEQAEEWMDQNRRQPFPEGALVTFTVPPHQVQLFEEPGSTEWITRHFERTFTGKVVRYFAPQWAAGESGRSVTAPASYLLLAMLRGEPEIVEVAAYRVQGLAPLPE